MGSDLRYFFVQERPDKVDSKCSLDPTEPMNAVGKYCFPTLLLLNFFGSTCVTVYSILV